MPDICNLQDSHTKYS